MKKYNGFLSMAKERSLLFTLIYCILAVVLVSNTGVAEIEKKDISVVYAKGNKVVEADTIADTNAEEETTQEINDYEEQQETIEESNAAMRLLVADELAQAEKERRELEEKRIHLSEKETAILQRIVEAEATGEDIKGKMLVANVIMNRVNSDKFPNTVEEVVFAKGQFSPIRDGRYYKVEITDETVEAVERVLNGEDESKGATYFMERKYANKKNASWFDRALTKVTEHGVHEFFLEE